ncbi:RND transporter [Agrobacterium rhizogenes]|nr:RND transporter [Rhizobium rhizogenes]
MSASENSPRANFRRAAFRVGVLLSVTSMISGCVVGPDYQRPAVNMPQKWGSQKSAGSPQPPVLADWWKRFKDPILDDLIARAVASSLDVGKAKAKIREARATTRRDIGGLFPSISGSDSATRNRGQTTGIEPTVYSQYEAGFDASWEIDLFGGTRRSIEAATYAEQSSEEDLRDTMVSLIGDVASYYIQAREYQQLTELAQQSAKSQRETAQLTRRQIEIGVASLVDVTKAEAQAAATQADVPSYQISYGKAVNRLSVLLGTSPLTLEGMLRKSKPIPVPPRAMSVGIPSDVLVSRPDVRSAERELAQATAKIGKAQADRYPSLKITGSIDTSATRVADLGKKSTIGWSVGPTLSIPIFQGGQLKAAVDVAKAQRDQYLFSYQSAVLSAMEDVENAIISLNMSRARTSDLALSVSRYREAAKLSRELYSAGTSDLFDVLDADRSLYSAHENLIQANADIASYYIALNKALGGGWNGPVEISTPAVIDTNEGPHIAPAAVTK